MSMEDRRQQWMVGVEEQGAQVGKGEKVKEWEKDEAGKKKGEENKDKVENGQNGKSLKWGKGKEAEA